jgi:hypothetical protein
VLAGYLALLPPLLEQSCFAAAAVEMEASMKRSTPFSVLTICYRTGAADTILYSSFISIDIAFGFSSLSSLWYGH